MTDKIVDKARQFAAQPPVEGEMTKRIEQQTAKIPSIGFLGLAVGSMVASAALAFYAERKELANFVGLWAPSLLLIGIYNKLVKLENEAFGMQGGQFGQHRSGQGMSGGQGYSSGQGYSGV